MTLLGMDRGRLHWLELLQRYRSASEKHQRVGVICDLSSTAIDGMPIVPVFLGPQKRIHRQKTIICPRASALSHFLCVFGSRDMVSGMGIFFAFLSPLCKILMFASSPLFLNHIYIGVRNHLQKNALLPESELASSGHVLVT